MYRRIMILILCMSFVFFSSANAQNIIWVCMNQDGDGDGSVTNDFQEFTDGLTAEGYTVDIRPGYWDVLTTDKLAELNAADLVIFSRSIQSGTFATDATEISLWNSVTTPVLNCSPYIVWSHRWKWVNNQATLPGNGDQGCPLMQVTMPTHPIFYGVSLDENNQLQFADPKLVSGNCSFTLTNDVGNGTLIAKTVPTTLVEDWFWIAEWQKGVEFFPGSGTNAGGHRLFLSAGAHETAGNGNTRNKWSGYNLTSEGWKLYLNAVRYMLGELDPTKASSPNPKNKQNKVSIDTILSWVPGMYGGTHDVFLGTDKDSVSAATTADPMGTIMYQALDVNSVELARLKYGTTYYWRVDEVNAPENEGTNVGNVWSFTTEPEGIDLGTDAIIDVTAETPTLFYATQEPNMTCNGSGLDANDAHSTLVETTMWLGVGEVYGDTWIQYEFDQIYKFHEMLVWNYNEPDPGQWFGAKDVNITYSEDGVVWKVLGDIVQLNIADGADGYKANTTVALNGSVAKFIKITFYDSWMDGIIGGGLSEVRFSVIPTRASAPDPKDEENNVPLDQVLSWKSGRDAEDHKVYIGTDPNEVKAGIADVIVDTDETMYSPVLELGKTYYWKVDEVNDNQEYPIWDGPVWNFSTIENIIVENFEIGYDDEDNPVYLTWVDGFEDTANGSLMGNGSAPYLSTTNHNGGHSSPMTYDNTNAIKSEVKAQTINLPIGTSDWTAGSPTTLVIWIYGDPGNDPTKDRLYAKIGTAKIPFTGDISKPRWMQFNVDLSTQGINKSNISSITIGVEKIGATGGTGMVLLDDMRLYRVAPALPLEEKWIEAESGTITPLYQKLSDLAGASGGQYVGVPDGAGSSTTAPPDPNSTNTLSVTVSGGVYRIDMRFYVVGTEASGDSCYVKIPTATAVKTAAGADVTFTPADSGWINSNNLVGGASWLWDTVISANNGNADVYWTLPAGTHTIKIANREDGMMLDAIVLVKVGN